MSTDLVEADNRELTGPDAVNHLYALLLDQWSGLDDFIASARNKAAARRLAIGRTLLGLQQLIDSGENGDQCTFWEWFDEMVPGRSRSDAGRLMTIARQPEPELASKEARKAEGVQGASLPEEVWRLAFEGKRRPPLRSTHRRNPSSFRRRRQSRRSNTPAPKPMTTSSMRSKIYSSV